MDLPDATKGFNVNSILSAVLLAAILWVGNKSSSNNDALLRMETQMPYINQSVVKLESQLALLVSRNEMESRLADFGKINSALEKRIFTLEFKVNKSENASISP